MCEDCRRTAESMVRSAQSKKDVPLPDWVGGLYRPPSTVIPKFNFEFVRLPTEMVFSHANGIPKDTIKGSGGLDPAMSSEICYSGDTDPGHVHWFDRLVFAAKPREGRPLSKVAELQGYGTDAQGKGTQWVYEFKAPQGTLVRSTKGSLQGEVCFPEPIPYKWITKVIQLVPGAKGTRSAIVVEL